MRAIRYVRRHGLGTLATLVIVALALVSVGLYRVAQLQRTVVDNQRIGCVQGNDVRELIRRSVTTLRDLIDATLQVPPRVPMAVEQTTLREKFVLARDDLTRLLPAANPRLCASLRLPMPSAARAPPAPR